MKKNKKVQDIFDIGDIEDGKFIDISSLTDNARILYKEYCEMLCVAGLPEKNKDELENIADGYYLEVFIKRMKTEVKNNPEIKSDIHRKETISYLREFAFKTKNTNLNKGVRSEIFSDPIKFHEHHKDNKVYDRLMSFLHEGEVEITNHLKDIYNVVNGKFSIYDLEDAISSCVKNNKVVYNIKYLYSILIALKENEEVQRKIWKRELRENNITVQRINEQAMSDEIEANNKIEFTKKEEEMFNDILSLGKNNDKKDK